MDEEVLILNELNDANNNLKWFTENYSKIQNDHPNEFVAIKDKQIMFYGPKLGILIKNLVKQKKDPSNYIIDFIYEKGECLVV